MRVPILLLLAPVLLLANGAPPVNALTPEGHILDWVLLGPFATRELPEMPADGIRRTGLKTDYLGELGGEAKAALTPETVVTRGGRKIRARRIGPAFDNRDAPVFNHVLDGYAGVKGFAPGQPYILEEDFNEAVGYAFCYLKSDRKQRVYAYFRTFVDAQKVWLNGQLVQWLWREYREDRPVRPGESKWWPHPTAVALDLNPGLNALLVKIESWEWIWQFGLTVYEEAHHAAAVDRMEIGFSLAGVRLEGRALRFTPRLDPEPIGIRRPVAAELKVPDGRTLARTQGETGAAMTLTAPEGYTGPAVLQANKARHVLYVGDFRPEIERARTAFHAVRTKAAALPGHEGMAAWLDHALSLDLAAGGAWEQRTVDYAKRFAAAIEQGGTLAARHPAAAIPVRFARGNYHIHLPRGFPEAGRRYPLIIDLHGRRSEEGKIAFDESPTATPAGAYAAMEGPPVIAAAPVHPNGRGGWQPEHLNEFLADVKRRFPIDEDRVYLQGGSMGGWGTWDWAIANPEHFAAIAPRCAFEGQPFRASRLKNVPVWVFNGEKDLGAVPALSEIAVSSVRRAGGVAEYTLFPHLGHGFRDDIPKWTVRQWFLDRTRSKEPPPPDPLAQLGPDGSSAMQLVDLPATAFFTVGEDEQLGYPQENIARAGLKMFHAYRRPRGMTPLRMADGVFTMRSATGGKDGQWEMLLEPPPEAACKAEGVLRCVSLPATRAARLVFRGTWEQLETRKAALYRELGAAGLGRTGEERVRVHGVRPRKLEWVRVFELLVAVR